MTSSRRRLLLRSLQTATDTSSLAAFRVLFGLTMTLACVRYLAKGFLHTQLLAPRLLFPYPGLELMRPLPGSLMYLHLALLTAAALFVAVGLYTRVACLSFALGFTYLELLDRSTYLNHYYLVSCLSVLLACVPAGGRFSLDARLSARKRVSHAPAFMLYALRLQVAVVYLYAGLAKLNRDWLLSAQPLRMWLTAQSDVPLFGPLLAQPATAFAASWLGTLFDLTVVPLLLWRRTRSCAFAALVLFHLATGWLLPIGMFPFIMLSAATLLLPPDWPRRSARAVRRLTGELQTVQRMSIPTCPTLARAPRWLLPLLAAHSAVQVGVPLYRQLAHPDAAWTYHGFDFAWRVMIAEKSGHVRLRVLPRRGGPGEELDSARLLTPLQQRAVSADPALIAALARHVAEQARTPVAVYVDAFASLNGRPSARLVDATLDVATSVPEGWILPPPD